MKELLNNADEFNRRRFLSNAAMSFLGVGVMPAVVGGRAQAALGPDLGLPNKVAPAKNCIYLYMNGGMTHMDTFDTKPGHENQGPVNSIKTSADGVKISEYLPLTAKQMHNVAIVNSMSSTAGAHEQGNYLAHTSYEQRGTIRHPGMGAWLLKFRGRLNENLPGSVFIGGNSRINGGAGFFESALEPLAINDPNAGLKNSKLRNVTEDMFEHRLELAGKLDAAFHNKYDLKQVRAYNSMYDDAVRIMSSRDLEAFDLRKESEQEKERYGSDPFGQGCLLARRLVEHDVRFVEVNLGGWDTHNGNFVNVPQRAEVLDRAFSALLSDLERRGMLNDTMVVLATEFGRTPRINQNAGRDHYPKAYSCLLAGAGIKGGVKYGKTSETGEEVIENKVSPEDFNATIAYNLGLPLDQIIYSPSRRPFTVAHKGAPVMELFS